MTLQDNDYQQAVGMDAPKDSRPFFEALPDESKCPECGYFDITHPDVKRALQRRYEVGDKAVFIQAKCKCEGAEQQRKARENLLWQQSGILRQPTGRTFQSFQVSDQTFGMHQAATTLSSGDGPSVLVLIGPTGCGKSHLLESTVRTVLSTGRSARYEMSAELVDRFRHTYSGAQPTEEEEKDVYSLMDWYNGRYLLALDDLGLERGTDFAIEILTRLVENRIRHQWRTIISTNKTKDELAERLGDRLASRLYASNPDLHDVKLVVTDAPDYRTGN